MAVHIMTPFTISKAPLTLTLVRVGSLYARESLPKITCCYIMLEIC